MLRNGSGAADEAALQECALWRSDEQLLRSSNHLLIPWAQPLHVPRRHGRGFLWNWPGKAASLERQAQLALFL